MVAGDHLINFELRAPPRPRRPKLSPKQKEAQEELADAAVEATSARIRFERAQRILDAARMAYEARRVDLDDAVRAIEEE